MCTSSYVYIENSSYFSPFGQDTLSLRIVDLIEGAWTFDSPFTIHSP